MPVLHLILLEEVDADVQLLEQLHLVLVPQRQLLVAAGPPADEGLAAANHLVGDLDKERGQPLAARATKHPRGRGERQLDEEGRANRVSSSKTEG